MSDPVCSLSSCGQPAVLVWLKYADSTDAELVNVFSCQAHQISTALACLTHQSTCTAPNPANLPSCDCTPANTEVAAVTRA
jgi:hypothetical protein